MSETQSTRSAVSRLSVLDWVWIYLLVTSTCLRPNRATIQPCDASLQTIKDDFRCPRNQFEWNKKAEEMKCASFSQSCTETSDFVYHCLRNAWGNGTIHVCAPTRILFGGSCAEFSKGGARVQEHYLVGCTSCPFYYNSTTSYMYQECYENITTPTTISTEKDSSSINFNGEDMITAEEKNEGGVKRSLLLIGLIVIIITVVVTCMCVGKFLYVRRKRTAKSAERDTTGSFSPLEFNPDFLNILWKIVKAENEGKDVLKRKIHESECHKKYANYCLKPNIEPMSITGNWRTDLGIQTAADVFSIKIYVVIQMESGETKTYCFFPKDSDTEEWMKIAFEKEKDKQYMLLSDFISSNEEDANLTYDDVFDLNQFIKSKSESEEGTSKVFVQETTYLHHFQLDESSEKDHMLQISAQIGLLT
ncbi:uncharacterized protein LOC130052814 isoform X2 [Ostrea edulis]|uniref:uncharacterized protein LOC130052814 isoform X2 n=1 Tax=Ostrea edulis TaxID=37623 RepID=UPI0024AF9DEC|nr:uncharacterized protein LOC130052814 isoform X2 [Ostrea edulis]